MDHRAHVKDDFLYHNFISWGFPSQTQPKKDIQNLWLFSRTVTLSFFLANSYSSFDPRLEVISSKKMPLGPSMCYYSNCTCLFLYSTLQMYYNCLSLPCSLSFSPPASCGWCFIFLVALVASSVPEHSKFLITSYGKKWMYKCMNEWSKTIHCFLF